MGTKFPEAESFLAYQFVRLMCLFRISDFLNTRGSILTLIGQLQKLEMLNFYKGVKYPCRISFLIFGHQAKPMATPL